MGMSTKYVLKQLLKIVLVIVLIVGLFVAGTMIGYGVMGDGSPKDVFKEETWTHITDFFK